MCVLYEAEAEAEAEAEEEEIPAVEPAANVGNGSDRSDLCPAGSVIYGRNPIFLFT